MIIVFILFMTSSVIIFGQDTLTFYYQSNGKKTEKITKAKYSRQLITYKEKILMTKTLLENGQTVQETELESWEPYIENGLSIYYDSSPDSYKSKGFYKNGNLDSLWIYQNANNSYDTVNYSGIELHRKYQVKDKETFFIVENMPLIGCYEDLKKKRESIDILTEQLREKEEPVGNNNEKYMDLNRQVLDINRIAFDRFKRDNLKYPVRAEENGVKGIVYAEFVVDEHGTAVEPRILKSVDNDLDTETIRLINALPICHPGTQRGKPVRVIMTVGVKFE
ncbi:energy transducer TonB [Gaoshiqia sp. Z1-71]|uniref:energy transducer TonB n=1 Tax=Gaoshiqia hydrogeniformans TaxID=3290090 RepID=UPI003BF80634